jgi:pilus assembly protein Flp/PilA
VIIGPPERHEAAPKSSHPREFAMKNLNTFLAKFRKDESGAAMVEYILIAGLIAVVCITVITNVGANTNVVWGKINTVLAAAAK